MPQISMCADAGWQLCLDIGNSVALLLDSFDRFFDRLLLWIVWCFGFLFRWIQIRRKLRDTQLDNL